MPKRAIDLSVEELGAMGARAARLAVQEAQRAGLIITGTVDIYENGQSASSLAQVLPSGTVTLVEEDDRKPTDAQAPTRPLRNRVVD